MAVLASIIYTQNQILRFVLIINWFGETYRRVKAFLDLGIEVNTGEILELLRISAGQVHVVILVQVLIRVVKQVLGDDGVNRQGPTGVLLKDTLPLSPDQLFLKYLTSGVKYNNDCWLLYSRVLLYLPMSTLRCWVIKKIPV